MRGLTQSDADAALRDYPDASKAEAAARMRIDVEGGKAKPKRRPDYELMFGRKGKAKT